MTGIAAYLCPVANPITMQNYHNHVRYYLPHHVFFYSCIIGGTAFCGTMAFLHHGALSWLIACALFVLLGWLSFMLRQHYALTLQNRLVRMEMRFRYFALTGKRLEAYESQLSFGQIAALRFASDDELDALLQKTLRENLSPEAIKRGIKSWVVDNMRV